MERVMAVKAEADHTVTTTTGVHMARRIGESVIRAYQGDMSFTCGDNEKSIQAKWVSR